jgi:hypothetical protein
MFEPVERIAPLETVVLLAIFIAIMVGINYDAIRNFRAKMARRRERRRRARV